jgi:uncharacterized membrane protein (DUF485 family)
MSGSIDVAYLLALLQFASTFLVAVVYSVCGFRRSRPGIPR